MREGAIDKQQTIKCDACKSANLVIDYSTGEIICSNCGLVIKKRSYRLDEKTTYTINEKETKQRTGYNVSNKIYDKGFATMFRIRSDFTGKKLSLETQEKMLRLRKQDKRAKIHDSWTRNLSIALPEMSRICYELFLPNYVNENAAMIYRKVLKQGLVKGRSIDGFVVASIYLACRMFEIPRSISDIVPVTDLSIHDVAFHYRWIRKKLGLKPPIDTPEKYISSFISKLNLTGDVEELSFKIFKELDKTQLIIGKNPRGVAASIIYLACLEKGIKITVTSISKTADISIVTLGKRICEYKPKIQSQ